MDIVRIWETYSKRIGHVVLLKRDIKDIYNKRISELKSISQNKQRKELIKKFPMSAHNMSFIDPTSGERFFYNHESMYLDDKLLLINNQKNREYQFLLMEAYEIFEDTLEELYAYTMINDRNIWPNEIKNISNEEIIQKDFKYFCRKANQRKGGAIKIGMQLIDYLECNIKWEGLSLKQRIIFVEKLRHIIVHKRGYLSDKNEFILKIAKDSGTFNNGKICEKLKEYINCFVSSEENGITVILDECVLTPPPLMPIRIEYNRFELLIDNLMVCIYLIIKKLTERSINNIV